MNIFNNFTLSSLFNTLRLSRFYCSAVEIKIYLLSIIFIMQNIVGLYQILQAPVNKKKNIQNIADLYQRPYPQAFESNVTLSGSRYTEIIFSKQGVNQ